METDANKLIESNANKGKLQQVIVAFVFASFLWQGFALLLNVAFLAKEILFIKFQFIFEYETNKKYPCLVMCL